VQALGLQRQTGHGGDRFDDRRVVVEDGVMLDRRAGRHARQRSVRTRGGGPAVAFQPRAGARVGEQQAGVGVVQGAADRVLQTAGDERVGRVERAGELAGCAAGGRRAHEDDDDPGRRDDREDVDGRHHAHRP
jgi:hypothetical protein